MDSNVAENTQQSPILEYDVRKNCAGWIGEKKVLDITANIKKHILREMFYQDQRRFTLYIL